MLARIFFSSVLAALICHTQGTCQDSIQVKGWISLVSSSTNVRVEGPGHFTGKIDSTGNFFITAPLNSLGEALISTDSSLPDAIWLEPGKYEVYLSERRIPGLNKIVLRTDSIRGPQDAVIYNAFTQHRYRIGGKSKEEINQRHQQFSNNFIDSILYNFPGSKTLPSIIRLSKDFIGDKRTAQYIEMLDQVQKNSDQMAQLNDYFRRKAKFEKDIFFENFRMKNEHGKSFTLSSVKAKLVLLDFWSSDCYPCRKQHEKFVQLYKKYHQDGLEIVSISMDNNKKNWLKAIKNDKMTWVNVSDLQGWDTPLAVRYFITVNPYSLWLKGNREIIGEKLDENAIIKNLGLLK
ncbi:MAG: TlpA family protein disulfide reductase [Sphingobacteriales bacterium]|nr:TlpA family protein disulfide reductase [Sphingobacteriales bacterium]OJW00255.1 MAG: hypothetical protein BGO52_03980 [Sphingobacteriales bacterium 44-61]